MWNTEREKHTQREGEREREVKRDRFRKMQNNKSCIEQYGTDQYKSIKNNTIQNKAAQYRTVKNST